MAIAARYGNPAGINGRHLRINVARGTELGKKADPIMKAGMLVSGRVNAANGRERLKQADCQRGYILDGFPPDSGTGGMAG